MNKKVCTLALLCALSPFSGHLSAKEGFAWPEGQKAAVSLSYDDALESQLDNALPVLDKHGIKASFYLTLSHPVVYERLDEWRALAANGHELGNHTLFHPCSKSAPGMDWVAAYNNLDIRTVEQMEAEVATANSFLKAIDGRTVRTMTPPCGHHKVADGDYVAAVSEHFVAIKGAEKNLPENFAVFAMPVDNSAEEIITYVKNAAKNGGIINIIFHGIGGDHLSNSNETHIKLIEYLAKNRDIYWTDTYLNIMQYYYSNIE